MWLGVEQDVVEAGPEELGLPHAGASFLAKESPSPIRPATAPSLAASRFGFETPPYESGPSKLSRLGWPSGWLHL